MLSRESLRISPTLVLSDMGPVTTQFSLTVDYQSLPEFAEGPRVKIWVRVGDLDLAYVAGGDDAVVAERLYSSVERSSEADSNFFLIGADAGPTRLIAAIKGKLINLEELAGIVPGDLTLAPMDNMPVIGGPSLKNAFPSLVALAEDGTDFQTTRLDGTSGTLEWSNVDQAGNVYVIIKDGETFTSFARWAGAFKWQDLQLAATKVFTSSDGITYFLDTERKIQEIQLDEEGEGSYTFYVFHELSEGEDLVCPALNGLVVSLGDEVRYV